jgi:hypothetical protein
MKAKQIYEATDLLASHLRRARQSEWARELEEALNGESGDKQKVGQIILVLRRLNATNIPPLLGLSQTITNLISEIEAFFKVK